MAMHRENREVRTETYRLVDPLAINFSGTSAQMKSETFGFDLDGDGKQEEISRLDEGSGFLALYDNDRNDWIDNNDAIFTQLIVWIKNDTDKGILEKLSET